MYGARFSTGILYTRMPLVPTPAHWKHLDARDQWHFSRVSTFLPVHTVNRVQTLKADLIKSDAGLEMLFGVPFFLATVRVSS
jgi:hypothetical protein